MTLEMPGVEYAKLPDEYPDQVLMSIAGLRSSGNEITGPLASGTTKTFSFRA